MRYQVLTFDKPTVNGRIYRRKFSTISGDDRGYVTDGSDMPIRIESIIGAYGNLIMDDDGISCEIRLMKEYEHFTDRLYYYTCGLGSLIGNEVHEFTLSHIGASPIKI